MNSHVVATGLVFALLAVAHAWRFVVERSVLVESPIFTVRTLVAAAFAIWAAPLLFRTARR